MGKDKDQDARDLMDDFACLIEEMEEEGYCPGDIMRSLVTVVSMLTARYDMQEDAIASSLVTYAVWAKGMMQVTGTWGQSPKAEA
jgi:hypothetical protein|tara:strand:- start:467 stop:721 length:255 start_codon:yes stop_codon:yes gene_type:complete